VKVRAYSQDLRERVLRALDRGDRPHEIALRFEVSRVWVYNVRRRLERHGNRKALRIGGHRRSQLAHLEDELRAWIAAEPGLTLSELQQRLMDHGLSIKIGTLWHQLNKWELTLKKNPLRQFARARAHPITTSRPERSANNYLRQSSTQAPPSIPLE
jgi:transposase